MAFTATNVMGTRRDNDGQAAERVTYVNTAASTGGTISTKELTRINYVRGNVLSYAIQNNKTDVVITTDANASGYVDLIGDI